MLNASIIKREDITSSLIVLTVKPDFEIKSFEPGQYVALGVMGSALRPEGAAKDPEEVSPDKLVRRTYSIASSPDQKGVLEFFIAIVNEGLLTPRISLLKEGDRVHVAPKITGKFTVTEVPDDHNLILVATGTGLAPYISMIRTPDLWKEGRSVTLVQGVRFAEDLAYQEELQALAKSNSNFKYYSLVSRPKEGWAGHKGYVQNLFKDGTINLNLEKDHVFLCGNPAMVDETEKFLTTEKGFIVHSNKAPGNLHLEKYW